MPRCRLGMTGGECSQRLNVHQDTLQLLLATRPSPTEAILNLWEARNRETNATQGLLIKRNGQI